MDAPLVLDWPAAAVAGASVAGGKGWNLGRLHRYGFPVPAGGVLVADVYRRLVAEPAIRSLLAGLADVDAERAADPTVVERLSAARAAIEAAPLPADVVSAVRRFAAESGLGRRAVAVRSSATAEDGPTASFAGMHRSVLNVWGIEAALAAVKTCFASLWTPHALAYRRRLGISDEQTACAVVICAMVERAGGGPPIASGVGFTCDPRTGLRDRLAINAAPGLGEDLVGGRINPEEIAAVLELGELGLYRGGGGGARRVLTDEQVRVLANLLFRVHWALGEDGVVPQDVEWAFDGRRFVLLQARPATGVPRPTLRGIGRLPVIWSNANLKDAVAGIPSAFIWSLFQTGLRHILYAGVEAAGYAVPKGLETVRRFNGRAYFDLTALQWAFYDAMGVLPADTNQSLGGHQPAIPVPADPFVGFRGLVRRVRGLRLVLRLIAFARRYGTQIADVFALAEQRRRLDFTSMTAAETAELLTQMSREQARFAVTFQIGNIAAGVWQDLLHTALATCLPREAIRPTAAALMTGSGSVTSAEHGYRLAEVADTARRDAAAGRYLTGRPRDPLGWRRLPAESEFRQAMEGFLAEFGHRGVYELDLANPRWSEDPSYLLDQVQAMLEDGPAPQGRASAAAVRAAAEAKLAGLPWWARPLVRQVAYRARTASARRESGKSALVALMGSMRGAIVEIGRRMTAAGLLESVDDVFQLTWADLISYLRGEWDGRGAAALAADRKAQVRRWQAVEPPDVMVLDERGRLADMPKGDSPAPRAFSPPVQPVPAGGRVLGGTAAASGRAVGFARIIRHPDQGGRLRAGEVLVAPSTDPGWTPLFLRAAAVVMETGGYLSHGAIVAREYGLPAVINIPGLLSQVCDGDRLTVDGDAGRVEIDPAGKG